MHIERNFHTISDTVSCSIGKLKSPSFLCACTRPGDVLGSGHFGMVYKGVLDSGSGAVDVAVKTLKEGSREEDRVKFLQEAAIMGQFKHHGVVEMYGVVTLGEPVSCFFIEILKAEIMKKKLSAAL